MLRAPVLAALALILGGSFLASEAASVSPPFAQRGTVTALVDPVTLDVRLPDGSSERVQLYGVAAPATASCAVTQATADAADLALGKPVWLVAVQGGPPKNRRRPLPAYVILPGGPDLGLQLVKRGDATVRPNQHPFKLRAAYVRAEKAAQAASLGVWGCATAPSAGTPTTPTTATPNQAQGRGQGHGNPDHGGSGQGSGNGKK